MTVTRNDAATALHDVDSARRHSLTLFQYGLAGPYLLLWGVCGLTKSFTSRRVSGSCPH